MSARQDEPGASAATAAQVAELMQRLEETLAELEQTRAQLEHADRLAALGTLAATIAHEFNNLITPSTNWAQLALRAIEADQDSAELAKKALTKCHAAGTKAGRIAEAILNFARGPEEGGDAASCDVAQVVEEALCTCARQPERDGIEVRRKIADDLRVAMDPLQLEHVLVNLLINARQAMAGRRRGTITVVAEHEPGLGEPRVRIEITDTGCGIEAEDLPRIFDTFYSRRDASSGRGTGLGLGLCRQIIQRHHGQITAHSTPGRGTTFRLLLPAAAGDQGHGCIAA